MTPENIFWMALRYSDTIHKLRSIDHGPGHWAKVDHAGIELGKYTPGADMEVVRFFALFHDTMRESEWRDPEHGKRGADLALDLGVNHMLTRKQWAALQRACIHHDAGMTSDDPTIGVCWDADRLDLPRVGILPDPALFSTEAGRSAAERLVRELSGTFPWAER